MNARQWITGSLLLALLGLAVAGLVVTREPPAPPADEASAKPAQTTGVPRRRERRVDTQPLLTARKMVALATTPEEQEFARQVQRLADHLVDLAFADAIRQAAENPPEPTPELRELAAQKEKAQKAMDGDRRRIKQIGDQLPAATGKEKEKLEDQLEVAKAQAELDQDELEEASANLERAGGDPQARIQRLKAVYEVAQKASPPAPAQASDSGSLQEGSLLVRIRAWNWRRDKVAQLSQAMQEAIDRAQRLTTRRENLAQRVRAEAEAREAAKHSAAGFAENKGGETGSSKEAANAALASLKRFGDMQRRLTEIAKRIHDLQELGDVYASWVAVAAVHARAALHRVIQGIVWVLLVLLVTYLMGRGVDRLFRRVHREKLRIATLRTLARVAVQVLGVLVVLFILFGVPSEATTILGLAGAGLTVAMKDFIVAFIGWFVLMGRNGIRVGDWVEIEGVSGEVAEIGLFHTVLLETGSWSDAGHPTGRRVSFVNSFAIERHFFNFSTSGQWMWDELRITVPAGQDPYPIIDGVQKLVEQETQANARLAEQEWQKSSSSYRVHALSAVPAISIVPAGSGIEIHVRYITRAQERHEARRRLNGSVVALMHGRPPGGQRAEAGVRDLDRATDPGA